LDWSIPTGSIENFHLILAISIVLYFHLHGQNSRPEQYMLGQGDSCMNNEPWLNVKCFLLDMDGTLNEFHIDCLFLTNNSSQHLRQYAEKITRLGLPIPEEKVLTSGEATALYLQPEGPALPIVWCQVVKHPRTIWSKRLINRTTLLKI
jgi:Haloacid dehalogenase-like hydrolase